LGLTRWDYLQVLIDYYAGERAVCPEIPSWAADLHEQAQEIAAARLRNKVAAEIRKAEYEQEWLTEWGGRARAAGLSTRAVERIARLGRMLPPTL